MSGPYKSRALNRAYWNGRDAASKGIALSQNPYRRRGLERRPRSRSWSEAWSRAWALGWHELRAERAAAPAAPAAP